MKAHEFDAKFESDDDDIVMDLDLSQAKDRCISKNESM